MSRRTSSDARCQPLYWPAIQIEIGRLRGATPRFEGSWMRLWRDRLFQMATVLVLVVVAIAAGRSRSGACLRQEQASAEAWPVEIGRPVIGRLSVGRHTACPSQLPGRCDDPPRPGSTAFNELSGLVGRTIRRSEREPRPDALHRAGLALLAMGGDTALKGAVKRLDRAADLASEDPDLLSDAVAARLALADAIESQPAQQSGQALILRLQALDDALTVLEEAPSHPAGLFNYALVLERLDLRRVAAQAWSAFFELEGTGDWALEARTRLADLQAATVPEREPPEDPRQVLDWAGTSLAEARVHLEQVLLSEWADAELAGGGSAELSLARRLAELLAQRTGDMLLTEAVDAIAGATPERRRVLAEAHRLYREGLAEDRERNFGKARSIFEHAARLFDVGESPMGLWARYHAAVCTYGQWRLEEAVRFFTSLEVAERHPYLEARRRWMLNLITATQGEYAVAIEWGELARKLVLELGDQAGAASMAINMASVLARLSREDEAWAYRMEALSTSARLADERLRHVTLIEISNALWEKGLPRLAQPFLMEAEANARQWGRRVAELEVARQAAGVLFDLDRFEAAVSRLEQAEHIATQLADRDLSERLRAELVASRAAGLVGEDPGRAVTLLDEALATYSRLDTIVPQIRLHRLRAQAALGVGDADAAERSLSAALEAHRRIRTEQQAPVDRRGYLAEIRDVYEAQIELCARWRRDPSAALLAVEELRLGLFDGGSRMPADISALRRALPVDAAVVTYAAVPSGVFAWVLSRQHFLQVEIAESRRELDRLVARHGVEIQTLVSRPSEVSASATLYDLLWQPLAPGLVGVTRVAVVTDPELGWIGYSGLWNRRERRFLIEEVRELVLAPAVSVAVNQPEPQEEAGGLLIVGDPAFDQRSFPALARLPGARVEAERIAAVVPSATLLLGTEATHRKLAAAIGRHRALHFAGHFLPDADGGAFLLSPGPGEVGLLRSRDFLSGGAAGLDLVVLSSCRVVGPHNGHRRHSGWVQSLLAQGVQGVVASPFEVEDGGATELFREFYRRFGGSRPAAALRDAKWAVRERPLAQWVPFELHGGLESSSVGPTRARRPFRENNGHGETEHHL